jgi:hypothetical protein
MKSTHSFHPVFLTAAAATAVALSLVAPLRAQDTTARRPVTKDWITHHLVFSNPGTKEDAIKNGTYDRWLAIVNDPRYIMQQAERALMASVPEAPSLAADDGVNDDSQPPEPLAPIYDGPLPHGLAEAAIPPPPAPALPQATQKKHNRLKKDWSETLGPAGTVGATGATAGLGEFPATYENTVGIPSCTLDFAVFNTGLAGASNQASIIAYNELYGTTITPNCTANPAVYWAHNTGGTIVNSPAFYAPSNALNETGTQMYLVQTVSGVATLTLLRWATGGTLTGPTAPTAESPTSNYYNGTTSCSAPCMTSLTFSGSPADTYSSPYYDPSSDTIYVGDDAGKLHQFTPVFKGALKEVTTGGWPVTVNANASLGSPVFYNTGNASTSYVFVGDYPINFASNCQPNVTNSNSPCGYLYAVNASTAAVTTSAQLDYNDGIIDSPVLDSYLGSVYVFVGQDNNGTATGTVNTSGTAVTWETGSQFATGSVWSGLTITINGVAYVIASVSSATSLTLTASAGSQTAVAYSLSTNCGITGGPVVPCAGVYQFTPGFASGSAGNAEAQVGLGSEFMMSGTFDNAYYSSSGGTGHMYVVGDTGPANNTLYQISISSNVMSRTTTQGPQVATNYTSGYYAAGLQVTEYGNSSTDFIFLSVLAFGNPSGCAPFTGTVNTSGTAVTWESGSQFVTGSAWVGLTITINGVPYVVASVSSATSLTLTATAGTQTGVAYSAGAVSVGCVIGYNVTSGSISPTTTATGATAEAGGTSGIVVDYVYSIYYSTLLEQSCSTSSVTNGCAIQISQSAP